jgi:hypothetical protein
MDRHHVQELEIISWPIALIGSLAVPPVMYSRIFHRYDMVVLFRGAHDKHGP